ncbi:predicted protein [Botrytis cinerea T4]|uniref:Uncharacterized protein n=1 Tax=Botryotinia fuckeliana (strain T4) TaxID=999810 RepID=G2YTJ9_BOTF4|nr:predicted protein [Botrytis cinerea T4]
MSREAHESAAGDREISKEPTREAKNSTASVEVHILTAYSALHCSKKRDNLYSNTVDLFLATYLIYLPLPQSTSHRYTQIKSAEFHIVHPTRLLKNVLCMSVCM